MHDPITRNRQGNDIGSQYRAANFVTSPEQRTVAEDVKARLEASGKWKRPIVTEIVEAARMAGAEEFIDRLPQSYETIIEESGANFSGGQRQRIAIARALLTRPRLLIFDEATSALDPESEAIVQDNLHEIARGRTLIIVSHRLTSLAGADAILVLESGRVTSSGEGGPGAIEAVRAAMAV